MIQALCFPSSIKFSKNVALLERLNDSLIFVRAFKKTRKARGLTQKAVAAKMGITPPGLNPYAKGKIDPGFSIVLKVAEACGYHIVDFLALGRKE